jgi:hypothetical protein
MNTTKRNIAVFSAALAALTFTSVGTVSAQEAKEPVVSNKTVVKTSTTANKNFHNRRGYYDRFNDVWVYVAR